jgi:hypothetical protein
VNVRKLLDWRKVLIYSHRWLGIVLGILFVVWCISGIVLMYYSMPRLTAAERLMRMQPLDLSSVRITPSEAANRLELKSPSRLRVAMLGDRPVYRIMGGPTWSVVYADTGEPLKAMNAEEAKQWLARFLPESASKIRYDGYLTTPGLFTIDIEEDLPMHRFALDDAANTKYFVSETTGEAVMKTDTMGRILGFSSWVLHRLTFMKVYGWWGPFWIGVAWFGLVMCLSGVVLGIWRYGLSARFRHKGVYSHSPYKGWMKWHHYAGLIFGVLIFTWTVSGSMMANAIPGVAGPFFGGGRLTPKQLDAIRGGPVNLEPLTVDGLRQAAAEIAQSFPPKELEYVQFSGKPYFVAYRPPDDVDAWISRSLSDFNAPLLDQEHLIVSATVPQQGAFSRFDNESMMEAARVAMPGVTIKDSTWLNEYDSYYYEPPPTFNSANIKAVRPLPVLRVRFDDAEQTLLYLAPTHGQVTKYAGDDRFKRWGYFGLHGLDFGFLLNHRPLWDIVTGSLLVGCTVLSVTTLVPMVRRLKRHGRRISNWEPQRGSPNRKPTQQLTMADVDTAKAAPLRNQRRDTV